MAKDRARDPKRVYQTPTSHVRTRPQDERNVFNRGTEDEINEIDDRTKYNAFGKPDFWHNDDERDKQTRALGATNNARKKGTLPVQKFDDTK